METKTEFETDHEKNEILAQLSLWKTAPMIQIRCREKDNSEDIEIVCPYFIVDPKNLILQDVPGTDHVEILNQGVKVFELDPLQGYTLFLKPRVNEVQTRNLVSNWTVDSKTDINVLFLFTNKNKNKSETSSFKNSDSLFGKLLLLSKKNEIVFENAVLLKEQLEAKKLIDTDQVEHNLKNFMEFKINNEMIADRMIQLAFKSYLEEKGEMEKHRLMDYIKNVNNMEKTSQNHFYIPFINVCQSSGSGKSKIATELMKEFPASYVVLRDDDTEQFSYPMASALSRLFMIHNDGLLSEDYSETTDDASKSIVGCYLLLLKALFKDYLDTIQSLISRKEPKVLEKMSKLFVEGKFMGKELELLEHNGFRNLDIDPKTLRLKFSFSVDQNLNFTIEQVIKACQSHLADIFKLEANKKKEMPFVLVLDEASLMTDEKPGKISLFRLFRRAVHALGPKHDFVVLTLGTNSDIVDLNPGPTVNSFRESKEGKLFPIFILNRIWDIFLNYDEFSEKPIGYYSLRCGKMLTYLFSLGRPVWSSIKLSDLVFFAEKKVTNGSLQSGEAYLAFWMIRTGLLTNPAHVINSYLVSSLMATLLFASPGLDYIRVYYPSEPALAIAARKKLDSVVDLQKYYEILEKFIYMHAVDQGKFSEIISMDITLRAISQAETVPCDWGHESKLPAVCSTRQFILENRIDEDASRNPKTPRLETETDTTGGPSDSENRANLKDLEKDYRIVTVKSFLIKMYGESSYAKMKKFIPKRIKSGLINTSHLIQFHRDFPKNYVEFEQGTAENSTRNSPCDIFTSQALGAAAARGTGIICPPNYFGLDYAIPVVLKPLTDEKTTEFGAEECVLTETLDTRTLSSSSVLSQAISTAPAQATEPDKISPAVPEKSYQDMIVSNDSDDEGDNSAPLIANEAYFETAPQYTMIGIQVKRASPGSIKNVVAKGALSNHIVKCGVHSAEVACTCNCTFRLKDTQYQEILRNGLMIVHSMSVENEEKCDKEEGEDMKFNCASSGSLEDDFPKHYKDSIVRTEAKNLLVDAGCRFSPDVYLSGPVSKNIGLHVMFKKRTGCFTERLTAIHSTGLEVFNNGGVLPEEVAAIASRIILNDRSVFSEVSKNATNTYGELIASVVSRSNDGSYPRGSNLLRSSYGRPLIEPSIPDYSTLSFSNLQYFGRDPDEEIKQKKKNIPK